MVGLDAGGVAACHFLRSRGTEVWALGVPGSVAPALEMEGLEEVGIKVLGSEEALLGISPEIVVLGSNVPLSEPALSPLVSAGIKIVSELELAARHYSCMPIAVAGTNGKTTTAELIERMLSLSHRTVRKAGGSGLAACGLVPESKNLDYAILEVSSFQLESVELFRPSIAVLLNLKPDHMDHYDRMANYARTVARLFQNQQVFDWAIVQSEALALLHSLGVQIPCKVITFSAANPRADLVLDRGLLVSRLSGWEGPLLNMGNCRLQGPHQAENMLAALAVGHVLRLRLEEMVEALQSHEGGPHRCELVGEVGGVSFVNDSKAMNVEALRRAIESMPGGRIGEPNLWLIAGGKDKGLDYHDLGPLIAQRVKGTFLLGQTRDKLRAAWSLFTPCTSVDSLEEAVELASSGAVPGDVVLLSPACSSLDMFQNYQQRGEVFRTAAQKWMSAQPGGGKSSSGGTV